MIQTMKHILTINCVATSTKLGLFEDDTTIAKTSLDVPLDDLAVLPNVLDQMAYRTNQVRQFMVENHVDFKSLDIVVARSGGIYPVPHGGAYEVNELMVATLRYAPAAQHAGSLGALIGKEIVGGDIPVIIYDPTVVDCVDPIAKITGIPEIVNMPVYHLLNPKAAGRAYATAVGSKYEDLNMIIVQLGGGISMAFHDHGRVADWVYDDEGPMSPQRAGGIPTRYLTDFIFGSGMSHAEMRTFLVGHTGVAAYLHTQDMREVEARIVAGDKEAEKIFKAMAYGVAKGISQLAAVRGGNVDQIVLTGGLAHSERFTDWVKELVSWIAGVTVIPGDSESEALAAGGLRVLRGEEPMYPYDIIPTGYHSIEELKAHPSLLASEAGYVERSN